jgi:hypothetical protein
VLVLVVVVEVATEQEPNPIQMPSLVQVPPHGEEVISVVELKGIPPPECNVTFIVHFEVTGDL